VCTFRVRGNYVAPAGKGNADRPRCTSVVIPTAGVTMVNKCV
jgi:hypothetical protein